MTIDLGSKPAREATFLEATAAALMQGSVTCDGKLSPERHADYAVKAAEALIAKLAQRQGGAS